MDFLDFLMDKGVLEAFMHEVEVQKTGWDTTKEEFDDWPYHLQEAFVWRESVNGWDFWNNLDNEWVEICGL